MRQLDIKVLNLVRFFIRLGNTCIFINKIQFQYQNKMQLQKKTEGIIPSVLHMNIIIYGHLILYTP